MAKISSKKAPYNQDFNLHNLKPRITALGLISFLLIVLVLVGGPLLYSGIVHLDNAEQLNAHYTTATGTITDKVHRRFVSYVGFKFRLANGMTYVQEKNEMNRKKDDIDVWQKYNLGDQVPVVYSSQNPHVSYIDSTQPHINDSKVNIVAGGIVILLCFIGIITTLIKAKTGLISLTKFKQKFMKSLNAG